MSFSPGGDCSPPGLSFIHQGIQTMSRQIQHTSAAIKERPWEEQFPIRRDPLREPDANNETVTPDTDLQVTALPVMQIAAPAYFRIMSDLTTRPPEAGGVLVGPQDHDAVTHYFPDETGDGTPVSFTFDHVRLNRLLSRLAAVGLDAKGVVHSHPSGCPTPSQGDLAYVDRCFALAKDQPLSRFLLPIVCGRRIFPYVVLHDRPWLAQFAQVVLF
jgi:proteasome lid subunit RPN8/RPN11